MIRARRPKKAGGILQSSEAHAEQIALTTEVKPVQPLQPPTATGPGPAPALGAPQQALTLDDFDEEDVTNSYGALLESGAFLLADVEITLNEERIKKRGRQLYKVMRKYNLSIDHMDLLFLGVGVVGDMANVCQQIDKAKKEKGGTEQKTEGPTAPPTSTEAKSEDFLELQKRVKI